MAAVLPLFQTINEMDAVKKVLIPTDFSVKSLNLLLEFLKQASSGKFEIILAHGYDVSNSFSEMLFYSEHKILAKLLTKEFKESCHLIENTYQSRLHKFRFSILTGNGKRYVRNYVEANKIDLVVCPKEYKMKFRSGNSFDLQPYLKTSNVEVLVMDRSQKVVSELENTEQLADILLSNIGQ